MSALSHDDAWLKLTRIYKSTCSDIDDTFQRIEKLAQHAKLNAHTSEFSMLQQFLTSNSSSSGGSITSNHEQASVPCIILPQTLTTRCYDRDAIIADIEKHFESQGDGNSLMSLALWGLGGVGKSHVALKYARSKTNELDAIFWIHSQDSIAIAQSFSDAAVRLQLPGINPQNHIENRVEMLNWLQRTSKLSLKLSWKYRSNLAD